MIRDHPVGARRAAAVITNRRRVQATVDRRFDRARVDRDRAIVKLGNRLRDAVEIDAIRADVVCTIDATIRPVNAAVWLRHS